jgi:hypothetical protein
MTVEFLPGIILLAFVVLLVSVALHAAYHK